MKSSKSHLTADDRPALRVSSSWRSQIVDEEILRDNLQSEGTCPSCGSFKTRSYNSWYESVNTELPDGSMLEADIQVVGVVCKVCNFDWVVY